MTPLQKHLTLLKMLHIANKQTEAGKYSAEVDRLVARIELELELDRTKQES